MRRKKIAIITGATSGFGEIFARMADVQFDKIQEFWLVGRQVDKLVNLSNELSHKTKLISSDLTEYEELEKISELLEKEKPMVKLLVNSAGFGITGHVENQNIHQISGMIDLNCRALTYLSRAVLPFMARNSRIVNFASAAAFMPQPSFAVYAATKAYVLSFTRALNAEMRKKGVYVTAVCPGPADTNFFQYAEQNGDTKSSFYKKLFMVKPEYVVEKALRDSILKKEISVYSLPMKGLYVMTKIIPRRCLFSLLR